MSTQEELTAKLAEYETLLKKIEAAEPGMIRQELKRRKNNITGECVVLRQKLIAEELKSENPKNVPRLPFSKD